MSDPSPWPYGTTRDVTASRLSTQNWAAWIDLMPPPPDSLNVYGEVLVGNPGIEAHLCIKNPQGINPAILLLDLHLVQRPGNWIQLETWAQARFHKVVPSGAPTYTNVEIFFCGERLVSIAVDEVR